jgi:phosphoserine phosphatase
MNQKSCRFYCYRNSREPNTIKTNRLDKIDLVLFDMDGVLTDTISSWKYIHEYFGCSNERSVDEYLRGEIDDMEFIKRDVTLWKENGKPIKKDRLVDILSDIPLMRGAKECIDMLKENQIYTVIVSAGLDILAERVGKKLDIDFVFANGIKTDENGRLNGEGIVGVGLIHKDKNVINISDQLNIPLENIVGVGNSCFDIPMLETCGMGIAFNPEDECIKKVADFVVEGKDLRNILPYIQKYL